MNKSWIERLTAQHGQLKGRFRKTSLELTLLHKERNMLISEAIDLKCGFILLSTLYVEGPKEPSYLIDQFGPEVLHPLCNFYAGRIIDTDGEMFYLTEDGNRVVANIERALSRPLEDYKYK